MSTSIRKLLRSPAFAAASILTLALGIGANTAIFSIVNSILLRPLPYEAAEDLVSIMHTAPGLGFDRIGQSAAQHFVYREESQAFTDLGMWEQDVVSVTGIGVPEEVTAARLTDAVLPLLRVTPLHGRTFTAEDDSPASAETTVLSFAYWQQRLGGDPKAIGRPLIVDGRPREIIGVLPRGFRFVEIEPKIYLPLQLDRAAVRTGAFRYRGIARLRPGVTVEAANADIARMIPTAFESFPGGLTLAMMREARLAPDLRRLRDEVLGDIGGTLWVLTAMVAGVLLVACANVINLSLVHAEAGRRDLAVRVAIGASSGRVLRDFVAEAVTLAVAGGAVGLALAHGAIRLLKRLAPAELPRLDEISIDPTAVAFSFGVAVLVGVVLGLVPLAGLAQLSLVTALREGGRGGGAGRDRHRLRNTLAAAEVALALVLLIGSGLMVRSFLALRAVDPGFEGSDGVLTLRLTLPEAEVADPAQVALIHEAIAGRLAEIPGVTRVGAVSSIPLDGRTNDDVVFVEDFPTPEGQMPPLRRNKRVAGDYFQTMGIPVLAGRSLGWEDVRARSDVVVVTQSFAVEYWGSPGAAVGRRIKEWHVGRSREIVGVVKDVRDDGVDQPAPAIVYWPIATEEFIGQDLHVPRSLTYVLRTHRAQPISLVAAAGDAVRSVNPNLPLAEVQTMDAVLAHSIARTAFILVTLVIAAAMAVLLGIVGIYGVVSYVVGQRTREIGVRMALGARRADVTGMVLRQGAVIVGLGAVVGIAAALALSRLMAALLFGVDAEDPLTYVLGASVIAGVAMLATYVPARRAARVEPTEALRAD